MTRNYAEERKRWTILTTIGSLPVDNAKNIISSNNNIRRAQVTARKTRPVATFPLHLDEPVHLGRVIWPFLQAAPHCLVEGGNGLEWTKLHDVAVLVLGLFLRARDMVVIYSIAMQAANVAFV